MSARIEELPPNELTAALDAVADALSDTDLSDDALFAADMDAEVLARQVRATVPALPTEAGLSEAGTRLYRFALDQSCRYLVQVIQHLPVYPERALTEVLGRMTTMSGQLADLLARTPRTSLDAPTGTDRDEDFRVRYVDLVATKLDRLELLGLTMRNRPRLALSVAYLSLTVTGRGGHRRSTKPDIGWFGADRRGHEIGGVRVEAAIGGATRVLIRGEAGSGKTTLLDWLAITAARAGFTGQLAEWNGCVPIPIRLRRHATGPLPRPEQFCDEVAPTLSGIMPDGWMHRCLLSGAALLLVDGVDEVPGSRRRQVRTWLDEIVTTYPKARVLVTSRPAAAEDRWLSDEGFASVELEPMSPPDVVTFVSKWHEAAAKADTLPCQPTDLPVAERRLLAQFDSRPQLRALATTPLLCAMLCSLNLERTSELPRNRMELYQAALAMLLGLRDAEREIAGVLDAQQQVVLLRDLAWRLTLGGRIDLEKPKALAYLEKKRRSMVDMTIGADEALDHLLERSGVLREPVPGRLDFVHRTFQEYLAASEATEDEQIDTLVNHAHLDSWWETIIMACGHAKRPQSRDLLNGILNRADREPTRTRKLRLLAAACLETVTDVDPDALSRVEEIIETKLVPPRSKRETQSLAKIGHRLLGYLPRSLDDLTEASAAATVRAAGLTGNPDVLLRLATYAEDPRPDVQRELIECWQYFDPERYAQEVLAEAPLVNGGITVCYRRLLPHLHYLNNVQRLGVTISEPIDDLPVLAHVDKLMFISAFSSDGRAVDLHHLCAAPALESIYIHQATKFTSISTLSNLPLLDDLYLGLTPGARWRSIQFLKHCAQVGSFGLNNLQRVRDYDVLRSQQKLTSLWLDDATSLTDLKVIRHLDLKSLSLSSCGCKDAAVQIAEAFPHLEELYLDDTPTEDITPLTQLPLTYLAIDGCPLTDLRPLAGKSLTLTLSADREYHGIDDLGPGARIIQI